VNIDTIPLEQRVRFTFDMCLSALIGEKIFNFGEMLAHPIMNCLRGTEGEWIVHLMRAFNAGDMKLYKDLSVKYATQMSAQHDLVANRQRLAEKITILGLMELVFKLPSDQRTIRFETIASATELAIGEVEHLIMKTLSLGLIRGSIDEVDKTVSVSWVQPRVLQPEQIAALEQRLAAWAATVRTTMLLMEDETSELFV